ncbi:MAG TPA: hypothetical protein VI455_08980 [Terriglobia bacterium]
MSDFIGEIKAASALLNVVKRPFLWLLLRIRVLVNQGYNIAWPPLTHQEAVAIAYGALRGDIRQAIPYRDLGSSRVCIAVLRSDSAQDHNSRVHLLRQLAGSYEEVFSSDLLERGCEMDKMFCARDVNRDGHTEIMFGSSSIGTGGGTHSVAIYLPAQRKLYKLLAQHQWSAPSSPGTKVSVDPKPLNREDDEWYSILEREIQIRGLSHAFALDECSLDDPRNAAARWHAEYGGSPCLTLVPHYYSGCPRERATVTATLEDGEITWIAYFKGAVYGYVPSEDKHFVLYSPADAYHWPVCLIANSRHLWIGTGGDGVIRYDKETRSLRKIVLEFEGSKLLEVGSMRLVGDYFEINGRARFPASTLRA